MIFMIFGKGCTTNEPTLNLHEFVLLCHTPDNIRKRRKKLYLSHHVKICVTTANRKANSQGCCKNTKILYIIFIFIHTGYLPTLYDFHFDGTREKWISWNSLVPKYNHDPEMKFSDILGNLVIIILIITSKNQQLYY